MYGDVPEVIRRSKLQTVLPENVEDKSVVCLRQVRRRHQAGFSLGQDGRAYEGQLIGRVIKDLVFSRPYASIARSIETNAPKGRHQRI